MTKAELMKALENVDDDRVIVITMSDGGWMNIKSVTGCEIRPDDTFDGIFSSDKE